MDSSKTLIKIDKPVEVEGEQILVLAKPDEILTLNSTARFVYENCNGETLDTITDKLYAEIINKDEVTVEQIRADCTRLIEHLVSKGLIRYQ